ncbi:MAG: arginine N-succinyltransferase [Proteobacteria bacterium]|nr:arginine N-succinyltransferase [Pseudomonadota bacterium]
MKFIRPVNISDLDSLVDLSNEAGVGLTTLPPDPEALQKKIQFSIDSFNRELKNPEDESYLFVLEDSEKGAVVGTTGIVSSVGVSQPFYTFRLSTSVLHSKKHKVYSRYHMLNLVNDFTGVSEICTLFLSSKHRKGINGKLLSRSRFLFAAEFPERFADVVIAEMRGLQDENGRSPFWKNLGMKFFQMDFSKADYLSAMEGDFITALMPKQPFYEEMLPEDARNVIGKVHTKTLPALKMLEKEGFVHDGYVDIFDAGPTVHCHKKNIYTVRNSSIKKAKIGVVDKNGVDCILCNNSLKSFRCLVAKADLSEKQEILLPAEVFEILNIEEGDSVRYVPLQYQPLQ